MKKIISRIRSIGICSGMATEQQCLVRLSNTIALFIILVCSSLGFLGLFTSEYITAIFDFALVILVFIPIVLNHYKKYTAAKLMLIFSLIFWVIAGAMSYGYDSVFKYVMILPIAITFIFFSEDSKWKLYFPILFVMLSLVFFEIDKFVNQNYSANSFNNCFSDEHHTGHIFESVTFMLTMIIFIMMQFYFRSMLKKKESELLIYKKVFDNSHESFSIIDTQGRYVKQNSAHEKIFGFTDKELESMNPALFIGNKLFMKIAENLKRTGDYKGEFISKTKGGEKYIDLMAFEIMEKNKALCYVGIHRDITKQKKLTLALENSEKKYRTLVNLMGEGLGVIDLNERFIFSNPQMEKIFEVEPGTLINRNVMDFLSPEQTDIKAKQSIFCTKEAITTHKLIIKSDCGQVKYVQVTVAPFIDNNKRNGTIAVVVDISEREKILKALKDSEENLKNADATKDKFLSIIGHDLRSPFNSLIGFSNLMIEKENSLEKMNNYAKVINEIAVSTFRLLDNLLGWARLQTNNLVLTKQNTDLNELVNRSYLCVKNQAVEKNIKIFLQFEPDIFVDVDKNMIETVIRNLITNAIKYCNKGDTISILSEKKNGSAFISVKDTGVGISKEVLPKLFKIGHSISTKGTNRETGTGLGLILCKEFVEKHGGEIWAESELGKGSIFKFTLPLKKSK